MKYLDILRTRLDELEARREAAISQMEDVTTVAVEESRSLTDDEQTAFDAQTAEIEAMDTENDELRTQIGKLEEIERRRGQAEQAERELPAVILDRDPLDLSTVRMGDAGEMQNRVTAWLDTDDERKLTLTAEERQSVNALVRRTDTRDGAVSRHVLAHASDDYRGAFNKVLSGAEFALTDGERRALAESRAATLTAGEGGYAIPTTLDVSIVDTAAHELSPMRQLATIKQTPTNSWTGAGSAGVTSSWDGELVQVSDDAATLTSLTVTCHKGQGWVPFSIEAGQDWQALEAETRRMFAISKDDLEAAAFVTGTGTAQPEGVVTGMVGETNEIAPSVAETFTPAADLYLVEEAVGARFRTRASWIANKAIFNDVRQGFDNLQAVWERVGGGMPPTLLGYPAYEASTMDGAINAAATDTNYPMVFGDFAQGYYIADRIGMSIELVNHTFNTANNRPDGGRGFLMHWRTGGAVVSPLALAMLSIPTTA